MSKKTDDAIMKLRDELIAKEEALIGSDKPVYIAGEYFRPNIYSQRGEFIVSIASENELLNGAKALVTHKEATELLGMSGNHEGFPVEDWIEDFKTRKSVLDRNVNLQKVAEIEATLTPLLSKDQLRDIGIGVIGDAIAAL